MPIQITVTLHCARCNAKIVVFDHRNPVSQPTYPRSELTNVNMMGHLAYCAGCNYFIGMETVEGDRVYLQTGNLAAEMELLTGEGGKTHEIYTYRK